MSLTLPKNHLLYISSPLLRRLYTLWKKRLDANHFRCTQHGHLHPHFSRLVLLVSNRSPIFYKNSGSRASTAIPDCPILRCRRSGRPPDRSCSAAAVPAGERFSLRLQYTSFRPDFQRFRISPACLGFRRLLDHRLRHALDALVGQKILKTAVALAPLHRVGYGAGHGFRQSRRVGGIHPGQRFRQPVLPPLFARKNAAGATPGGTALIQFFSHRTYSVNTA